MTQKSCINFIKDDLLLVKEIYLDAFNDLEAAEFLMATCKRWLSYDDLMCSPTEQPFEQILMTEKQL